LIINDVEIKENGKILIFENTYDSLVTTIMINKIKKNKSDLAKKYCQLNIRFDQKLITLNSCIDPTQILTNKENESYFRNYHYLNWDNFYANYPEFKGILFLSKISIINKRALLTYTYFYNWYCYGYSVELKFTNNNWFVVKKKLMLIC
jgi:hypothetical protein